MADINIKKKNKPTWPWILGILVAVAVIWVVVEAIDDEEITRERTEMVGFEQDEVDADQQDEQRLSAVMEFSSFVEEHAHVEEMGVDHEYTSEGIRRLAAALNEIVNEVDADVDMQQKKEDLKRKAEEIQRDPHSTQHANIIRDAFLTSSELMNQLQDEHFENMEQETANVQETAEAIDPNVETLNQRANVKAFFASANQAVQEMQARLEGQTTEQRQGQEGQVQGQQN